MRKALAALFCGGLVSANAVAAEPAKAAEVWKVPTQSVDLRLPENSPKPTLPLVVGPYVVFAGALEDESDTCNGQDVYAYKLAADDARESFRILENACVVALETDGTQLYVQTREPSKSLDTFTVVEKIAANAKTQPAFPIIFGANGLHSARLGFAIDLGRKRGSWKHLRNATRFLEMRVRGKALHLLVGVGDREAPTYFLDSYADFSSADAPGALRVVDDAPALPFAGFDVDLNGHVYLGLNPNTRDTYATFLRGKVGDKNWKKATAERGIGDTAWTELDESMLAVRKLGHVTAVEGGFLGAELRYRTQADSTFTFFMKTGDGKSASTAYQLFALPRRRLKVKALRAYKKGVIVAGGEIPLQFFTAESKAPFPAELFPLKAVKGENR